MIISKLLVFISLPYIGFTAYDIWMHNHDRDVPKIERVLHAVALISVSVFLISAITGHNVSAAIALAFCLPCMIFDELIYHKNLHIKELRIHHLAGASFFIFIGCWLWMIY